MYRRTPMSKSNFNKVTRTASESNTLWRQRFFLEDLECVGVSDRICYNITVIQEQPSTGVLRKSCSENMQQIYRRKPMLKLLCNFIEITLRHACFPVNLLHIFRTPFSKNTAGWLLLVMVKNAEVYSNPWQISKMKLFERIV